MHELCYMTEPDQLEVSEHGANDTSEHGGLGL